MSAYIVDGISEMRLAPIMRVAMERFEADQKLRTELVDKSGTDPNFPSGGKLGSVPDFRVVCQCWNVGEREILAALGDCTGDPGERLDALKAELKCGTNCGSCVPELRALVEKAGPKARRMVA